MVKRNEDTPRYSGRCIAIAFVSLLLAHLWSASAQETTRTGTVQGTVVDTTGSAIAGAQLTLRDSAGSLKGSTTTDGSGHFLIADMPPGNYVLETASKTFETSHTDVVVTPAGTTAELRIVLKVEALRQTVNVEARADYVQAETSTATKSELPTYATPLTIDTVSRGLFVDQASLNLVQVLENVSDIQSNDSVAGWGANTYQLRGFDLQNNLLQDGLRLPQYAEVDPAIIDHVDVLKGSAAGLYGRIEPGGVVNVVTLKPQPVANYGLGLELGQWDFIRVTGDATGAMNHNQTLLYRAIVAYENSTSYIDTVHTSHLTVLPEVIWNPRESDSFDVRFKYKQWQDTGNFGVPAIPVVVDPNTGLTSVNRLPNLPRSVYVGPSNNSYNIGTTQESVGWTHRFGSDWMSKATYFHYDVNQPGTEGGTTGWANTPPTGWGTQTPNIANFYVGNPSDLGAHGNFAELDITGRFRTWGLEHSLLLSGEYLNNWNFYQCWCYGSGTVDVNNPVYQPASDFYTPPSSTPPAFGYTGGNRWGSTTIQDQVSIKQRLRILAGLRYDWASTISGPPPATPGAYSQTQVGDQQPSPRVGVSYDVLSWLAAYGSWAKTFGGNSAVPLYNGQLSQAETSTQWEIGAKGHWFGNRLMGELIYFDLHKNNIVVNEPIAWFNGACTNPIGNSCAVQQGQEGSKGLEFELTGHIASAWSVNLTYANVTAKVLNSGDQTDLSPYASPVGQSLANVPRNSGSAWVNYRSKAGWSAGMGLVAVGSRPFDQPFWQTNATMNLPSYVLLNAVVAYNWKIGERFLLTPQLKLANLTNANAWQGGWAYSGAIPSAPFTAYGTLKLTFH